MNKRINEKRERESKKNFVFYHVCLFEMKEKQVVRKKMHLV